MIRASSTKYRSHTDYPLLGISEKYLLVEDKANICLTGNPYPKCLDGNQQQENYAYVMVADADALASGNVPQDLYAAQSFKRLLFPDNTVVPPQNPLVPAVHEGFVPFGVSFFVNTSPPNANGVTNDLLVWYLDRTDPNNLTFGDFTVPIRPLQKINPPLGVISAAFRGQELVVAPSEVVSCKSYTAIGFMPKQFVVIRVIIVDVLAGLKLDRTFGGREIDDPAPSIQFGPFDCLNYVQPAVQINGDGNIAVVYWRQGTTLGNQLPTEARYSVIYADGSQGNGLLQAGQIANKSSGWDTSGISLDPTDGRAIWFVQAYWAAAAPQIAIGRIWAQ